MSSSQICLASQASLQQIQNLKQSFEAAYDKALSSQNSEDLIQAQNLKQSLEIALKELEFTLAREEAEKLFDLRRQYDSQVALLKKIQMLQARIDLDPISGEQQDTSFITDIEGYDHLVPSYEATILRLREKKELWRTKTDQEFQKVLLVPFGMKLVEMIQRFRTYLRKYKQIYPEFGRIDPYIRDISDNIPNWDPLFYWRGYREADERGTLVYDPHFFDKNHKGITKAQILQDQEDDQDPFSGWFLSVVQSGDNGKGIARIPRYGRGKTRGTKNPRPDIETITKDPMTPQLFLADYMEHSQNPHSPYYGESGMTPEEWIMAFIVNLEETGKLLGDYRDENDSVAYLTGAYLSESRGGVPSASFEFFSGRHEVSLNRDNKDSIEEKAGVRFVVRG